MCFEVRRKTNMCASSAQLIVQMATRRVVLQTLVCAPCVQFIPQHKPNPGFGHPGKPRRTTLRVILRGLPGWPKPGLGLCCPCFGGGPKPGGRSHFWVCATHVDCPLQPGPVRGPGSWFGSTTLFLSTRPTPVSEVASLRDTTPFVMGGGGGSEAKPRPVWCPEAAIALAR